MSSIFLDINEIASTHLSVSVKVHGVARFSFRLKVATAVMRLAGWIMPVPVIVEIEDHEART